MSPCIIHIGRFGLISNLLTVRVVDVIKYRLLLREDCDKYQLQFHLVSSSRRLFAAAVNNTLNESPY